MPIFKIESEEIKALKRTRFADHNILERQDLQRMLKRQIEVLSPNTLIVAEEFGDLEGSNRRIDLLGIDKDANLVVIELKRTEDGGHMDLQAIRYASMISTLTFDKLIGIYDRYLRSNNSDINAAESLSDFLEWESIDEDNFAQEVKILLASAEFSKELTTSVIWLNDFGLDIRCVRMQPYENDGELLIDVQTVIPMPEAADHQIKIHEKKQSQRKARTNSRDLTKYDITTKYKQYPAQSKRSVIFYVVKDLIKSGVKPDQIQDAIKTKKSDVLWRFDGLLQYQEVQSLIMETDSSGIYPKTKRYFCKEDEPFHVDGSTWILSNQWGQDMVEVVGLLAKEFPDLAIEISAVKAGQ